ncbi:MAG: serine dehydratase subunit alpha family protein, partial [Lachnospiraceae bacterium]|nr:serine dehydratase subunit alpha family protein [Lachnospiraceae bacterium]
MHKLTELIQKDMKPALGVTEPGAIAFAVAAARERVSGNVTRVKVGLNSGMYKNAFTCGIPNSEQYGNLYAAALGAVAADASLGLESLADITEEDNARARELVEQGMIEVFLDHMGSYITIDAAVYTEEEECVVHIRGNHTKIQWIEKNGVVVEGEAKAGLPEAGEDDQEIPEIHRHSLAEILTYIETVGLDEIRFIQQAFDMNLELLKEGLDSEKTTFGPMLYKENG